MVASPNLVAHSRCPYRTTSPNEAYTKTTASVQALTYHVDIGCFEDPQGQRSAWKQDRMVWHEGDVGHRSRSAWIRRSWMPPNAPLLMIRM
jgi:hypothetical protein